MKILLALVAAVVLSCLSDPARAQMGGGCMMTQLTQLCEGMAPGSPEFQACAKQKSGQAIANCQRGAGEQATSKQKAGNPCGEDAKKYCPGLWPGTPEFASCMKKRMSDLSPDCSAFAKKRLAEGDKPMKAADTACVKDAQKLCPGLTYNDGPRFMGCMMEHHDALSPLCRKNFDREKPGEVSMVACSQALKRICPGADIGTPELTQCMAEHREDLPPACRKKGKR